jgi:transposase
VIREVLNGDILNVAAKYDLTEYEVRQMLSDVGKLKIKPPSTELKKLGIDEIALVKGQGNYVAVLVDVSNGKLLEIVPSRRKEDLRKVLVSWGEEVLNGIEEVSIDLWKPYKSLVNKLMPNAEVVADRFHVFKQVNDELDTCRKRAKNEANKIKNKSQKEAKLSAINRSKYVLLKNEKDLKEEQKIKLKEVQKQMPELGKMHGLKEQIRDIYERENKDANPTLLLIDWLKKAKKYFPKSVKTIIRWFSEVVGYFESGTTQGKVEGINNRLKLIKRKGYGFRNFDNFRLRSLLNWCF